MTRPNGSAMRLGRSPNATIPSGTTSSGVIDPMNSAWAMLVRVSAVKNRARSAPKQSPAGSAARHASARRVGRAPAAVLHDDDGPPQHGCERQAPRGEHRPRRLGPLDECGPGREHGHGERHGDHAALDAAAGSLEAPAQRTDVRASADESDRRGARSLISGTDPFRLLGPRSDARSRRVPPGSPGEGDGDGATSQGSFDRRRPGTRMGVGQRLRPRWSCSAAPAARPSARPGRPRDSRRPRPTTA